MSNLPNPPPDPASNNPRLRDITLATITTVVICEGGVSREVSCIALQDLIESDSAAAPTQIDITWISRLSYQKWKQALLKDLEYQTNEDVQLHDDWKIWISNGIMQLKVFQSDHGFRAAIAKWFAFNAQSPDSAITFSMKRLSIAESIIKRGRADLTLMGQ